MTREQQIDIAMLEFVSAMCRHCTIKADCNDVDAYCTEHDSQELGFAAGAQWADEHPNFENVWHDASEEPTTESTRVLATDEKGFIDVFSLEKGKFKISNGCIPWSSIVVCFNLTKWAYVSDILPKGGEK